MANEKPSAMSDQTETQVVQTQPAAEAGRTGLRGVRTGEVVSISGRKSVRVLVTTTVKHAKYGKYERRRKKYLAHDPAEVAKPGDVVEIVQCRPMSKLKTWRLVRVVRAAGAPLPPVADTIPSV